MIRKPRWIAALMFGLFCSVGWAARHEGAKTRIALLDLPVDDKARGGGVGHGTQMAREILEVCEGRCAVLPIVLSQTGMDLSAARYTEGVDRALRQGAQIIAIPSGARSPVEGSKELRLLGRALQRARRAGVPVIVAAGTGLKNPYQPESLHTLVPHRFPAAWVVAAGGETPFKDETLRSAQNFGPELKFRVQAPSSSHASARLAGWIAREFGSFLKAKSPDLSRLEARLTRLFDSKRAGLASDLKTLGATEAQSSISAP